MMKIEKYQGINDDGSQYGYVHCNDGGYFFTWHDTLEDTLNSLEADEIDGDGGADEHEVRDYLREQLSSGGCWLVEQPAIDDNDIIQLRSEAGEAGDLDMVDICDAALRGDEAAVERCKEVIEDARLAE